MNHVLPRRRTRQIPGPNHDEEQHILLSLSDCVSFSMRVNWRRQAQERETTPLAFHPLPSGRNAGRSSPPQSVPSTAAGRSNLPWRLTFRTGPLLLPPELPLPPIREDDEEHRQYHQDGEHLDEDPLAQLSEVAGTDDDGVEQHAQGEQEDVIAPLPHRQQAKTTSNEEGRGGELPRQMKGDVYGPRLELRDVARDEERGPLAAGCQSILLFVQVLASPVPPS